ncbi:hypothetical protein VNO77_34426 [Canavalia gladiata]|uniref:Uncharacterized protein n=1 Tax=Canavalia gladiata TaxID=3824 RepID=A0AAN9PX79_CANGL
MDQGGDDLSYRAPFVGSAFTLQEGTTDNSYCSFCPKHATCSGMSSTLIRVQYSSIIHSKLACIFILLGREKNLSKVYGMGGSDATVLRRLDYGDFQFVIKRVGGASCYSGD